jgi:hypothetical protein
MRTPKEIHDFYRKNLSSQYTTTDEEVIMVLVDDLIKVLLRPYEFGFKIDMNRLSHFDIDTTEPVNWNALKCIEVKKVEDDEDIFTVLLDEASPDECPTLCDYIEKYLGLWGWRVIVKTEW